MGSVTFARFFGFVALAMLVLAFAIASSREDGLTTTYNVMRIGTNQDEVNCSDSSQRYNLTSTSWLVKEGSTVVTIDACVKDREAFKHAVDIVITNLSDLTRNQVNTPPVDDIRARTAQFATRELVTPEGKPEAKPSQLVVNLKLTRPEPTPTTKK